VTRVATYSLTGPFAGKVQIFRQITGPQMWTVKIKVVVGDVMEELSLRSPTPILIGDMHALALTETAKLIGDEELASDASIDFYIQRKRK